MFYVLLNDFLIFVFASYIGCFGVASTVLQRWRTLIGELALDVCSLKNYFFILFSHVTGRTEYLCVVVRRVNGLSTEKPHLQ